ncbi:MAG TPA: nitroreductase family protein [Syntrophales bacterium]|nr:nitroreductase family protein [Syntrophales bacterium]
MSRIVPAAAAACFFLFALAGGASGAQDLKPIPLFKPRVEGGRLLLSALKDRRSSREFSPKKLPLRVVSHLLWCAWGVNRPESGKRTAPSALNRQEMDVYVITAEGVYLYDAVANLLRPVVAGDIRAKVGRQPFLGEAPMVLLYVADLARMGNMSDDVKITAAAVSTGSIIQNVYLYCASEGLNTVAVGSVDRDGLKTLMNLRPEQRVMMAQCVGYPKSVR